MKNTPDELLTIDEACAILKLKRSWFYQHIHAKTLPFDHVKVGHFVRIPKKSLMDWIEKQTTKGNLL
jgi:excisionase family DNA binding protein